MSRPITLFTGQWADLPLDTLAKKAKSFGYDGLELATWGDHFDVAAALADPGYVKGRWDVLRANGLRAPANGILDGHGRADRPSVGPRGAHFVPQFRGAAGQAPGDPAKPDHCQTPFQICHATPPPRLTSCKSVLVTR